ncbi:MAG: aminoacyl-tRNA hydrolase [Hyphomicrobiales bacterium]|nr:aminoacyl-tRNA hydrolase [Hyphomicrobiales bacterium]
MPIRVNDKISLADDAVSVSFIRASGPGGQNVNKVASAVQLRFDTKIAPQLPEALLQRLGPLAGQRMNRDGVVVISADRFRTQERNRADALERLVALVIAAAHVDKPRRATRPTRASVERRIKGKSLRGDVKRNRRAGPLDD